jgi:hypothetical protein
MLTVSSCSDRCAVNMLANTSRHIKDSRALIIDAQHLALLMRLDSLQRSPFPVIGGCSLLSTLTTHCCNLIRFSFFISQASCCPFKLCRLGPASHFCCIGLVLTDGKRQAPSRVLFGT